MGLVVSSLSIRCGKKNLIDNVNLNVEDGELCSLYGNKRKCRLLLRVLSELAKKRIEGTSTVSSAVSRELFGFMRVREYCLYQLGLREVPKYEKEELADNALALVGFSEKDKKRKIKRLSREQCLMLSLSEALLTKPRVIFLLTHAKGKFFAKALSSVQSQNIALITSQPLKHAKPILVS